MTPLAHILAAALLLGAAAWASNVWPGVETWPRAAVARFLWWGLPFDLIALSCDVPPLHAAYLGAAAWAGAWVPHTAMPDIRAHPSALLLDLLLCVLRALGLLLAPAAVFWTCGAFWFAMVLAVGAVVPAILLVYTLLDGVSLPGMRNPRQVAGVLFGLSTGAFVAMAILVPDPLPDLLA